jgi:hypothetical protein
MATIVDPGADIADWLKRAGIKVPCLSHVIIDIPVDGAVRVYIDSYGEERLFQVKPPDLSSAEIIRAAPKPETGDGTEECDGAPGEACSVCGHVNDGKWRNYHRVKPKPEAG